MNFEAINDKGVVTFRCKQKSCVPTMDEIKSMLNAGYKFKIDGKIVTKKRIKEWIDELNA